MSEDNIAEGKLVPEAAESDPTFTAPDHDELIGFFIDCLELGKQPMEVVPITLTVKGMLVSGDMISSQKYIELAGIPDVARQIFRPSAGREFSEPRRFIHLQGAKFYFGHDRGIPTKGWFLWRGRLCEVDGFSFGKLVVDVA